MPKGSVSSRKQVKDKNSSKRKTEQKLSSDVRDQDQGHRYGLRSRSQTVSTKEKSIKRTKSQSHQKRQTQLKASRERSRSVQTKNKPSPRRPKQKTVTSRRGRPTSVSICNRSRSGSPSPSRIQQTDLKDVIKDLKKRIKSIPIKDRPIPKTNDISRLGFELKTRLAMTSPVISETGKRGGRTCVSSIKVRHRFIPVWSINKFQDPSLICEIKVKVHT